MNVYGHPDPHLLGNGSVTAPSYAQAAHPNTGVYFSAAGAMNLGVLGGLQVTVGNGDITLPSTVYIGAAIDVPLVRDAAGVLAQKNGATAQTFRVYGTTTGPRYVALTHDGANAHITGDGTTTALKVWFDLIFGSDNANDLGASGGSRPRNVIAGTSFQVGTTPGTTGPVRIPNNTLMSARNAANSADITLIGSTAANAVQIGDAVAAAGVTIKAVSGAPIDLVGEVTLGVNTPGTFGASQNNFALSGVAVVHRLAATAGALNVTGFLGGLAQPGRIIVIQNVGANAFTITNQDAASTATNRVITGTGANLALGVDQSIWMVYDDTTGRWRVVKNA